MVDYVLTLTSDEVDAIWGAEYRSHITHCVTKNKNSKRPSAFICANVKNALDIDIEIINWAHEVEFHFTSVEDRMLYELKYG